MINFNDLPFEIRIHIFKTATRTAFCSVFLPRFERVFRNSRLKWQHKRAGGKEYTTLTEGLFHILHIVCVHGSTQNGRRPVNAVATFTTVTCKGPAQKACDVYGGPCCEGWMAKARVRYSENTWGSGDDRVWEEPRLFKEQPVCWK